ncbi:hypothetical protein ACSBR2_023102 [Camellia fascicularis]
MATAAAKMLWCVFERSILMHDMEIERRPYHRNCTCAMHKSKGACSSTNTCFQHRKILFPMKQPWNECSFSISFASDSSARNGEDINNEALSQR